MKSMLWSEGSHVAFDYYEAAIEVSDSPGVLLPTKGERGLCYYL